MMSKNKDERNEKQELQVQNECSNILRDLILLLCKEMRIRGILRSKDFSRDRIYFQSEDGKLFSSEFEAAQLIHWIKP